MKKKEPAFEERLSRLQQIVTILENGNSTLEESVMLYKEGMSLATACRNQLEQAQNDIRICIGDTSAPFVPPAENEHE